MAVSVTLLSRASAPPLPVPLGGSDPRMPRRQVDLFGGIGAAGPGEGPTAPVNGARRLQAIPKDGFADCVTAAADTGDRRDAKPL
ncbi:MAG: hypothetical protein ACK4OP_15875 [Gemmobacter sp.]